MKEEIKGRKRLDKLVAQLDKAQFDIPSKLLLCAEEALSLARKLDDKERVVKCLIWLAAGFQISGSYENAFEKAYEAIGYAERFELKEMRIRALRRLAELLADLEDYGAALITLKIALKEWKPPMSQSSLMCMYLSIGTNRMRLDANEGMDELSIALSIASKESDKRMMYWCIHAIGLANAKRERYDDAIGNYRTALYYYKETRQLYNIASTEMLLGEAYIGKKDFESGEPTLKQALTDARRHEFTVLTILICCSIAKLYDLQGKFPEAEKYLKKAVEHSPVNPSEWQTRLCESFSRHHELMGNYVSALEYTKRALAASKRKEISHTILRKKDDLLKED